MNIDLIQNKIYEIRGHRVMIDYDLSALYETETKRLKEAVRRNLIRFPDDFMFQLTQEEYEVLRSQSASLENEDGRGKHTKYLPFAFTEQGVAMLASVLRSSKAIEINIQIVRAFVVMRQIALSHQNFTNQLKTLEEKYDLQFQDVYEALNQLIAKQEEEGDFQERKRIGFSRNQT